MHKVIIRPLRLEDASISFQWRNDKEVWKYTGNRPDIEITEEIERDWLSSKLLDITSKRFAIEVDDIYIGNAQLTSITLNDAEFHIFLGNKCYWGKGISYLVIQQILRYAEYFLNLKTIYLNVNSDNLRAIKLYEKCGFKKIYDNNVMMLNLNERIKPTVSVFVMVYNHELFLDQCLNSIIEQKCLFDYEIIIGDDFSSDKSRKILIEFQNKYPGKFKLLLHEKNIGAVNNQKITLDACRGKYIAICEGDDYWTDPYKLQKQINFLDANKDVSVCYHKVDILSQKNDSLDLIVQPNLKNYFFTFSDSLQTKHGATLSMVFKSEILSKFSLNIFDSLTIGDWPLECLCTLYGKGYFMEELMGVYRVHSSGVSRSLNPQKYYDNRIKFSLKLLEYEFDLNNKRILKSFLTRVYFKYAGYLFSNSNFINGILYLKKGILNIDSSMWSRSLVWKNKFKLRLLIIDLFKGLSILVLKKLNFK